MFYTISKESLMNTRQKETGYMAVGVDMQNDFCPGGTLAVPHGDDVIEPFNAIATATRAANGTVVFTRDWHPPVTSHFDNWPPHCIAGTDGANFHRDLLISNSDYIISKGTQVDEDAYSGFQGATPDGNTLTSIITQELTTKRHLVVAIGGLATDYCVKATVLDALALRETIGTDRLTVIALHGCMRAVNINPGDERRALNEMQAAGAMFELPKGNL